MEIFLGQLYSFPTILYFPMKRGKRRNYSFLFEWSLFVIKHKQWQFPSWARLKHQNELYKSGMLNKQETTTRLQTGCTKRPSHSVVLMK